jgi:hypothetical protein
MGTKRTGTKRTTPLKVVKTAAEASKPAAQQDSPEVLDGKQRRMAALERGREKANAARKERARLTHERRAAGIKSPYQRWCDGEYPVSAWTDEEIKRGRPENLGGGFDGPYPRMTGKQLADIKRELLKRGQRQIDGYYTDALKVLQEIALHGENESARVKAADLLVQRTAGKLPDKVEIKSSDPWQDILDEVMRDDVLERVVNDAEGAEA